jgi:acetyl-CoA carboxylase biotin carboxyl carrier protein
MANTGKKSGKTDDIDSALVRKLAKLLDETHLTEIEYGRDDWHVRVAKYGSVAAPSAAAAPTAPTPVAAPADVTGPGLVRSPMVGVVYTSPEPDQPPFVRVGDKVEKGQTLLLIEAMKVFNPIEAPIGGTVVRINVTSGAPVEFDEPLLIIE